MNTLHYYRDHQQILEKIHGDIEGMFSKTFGERHLLQNMANILKYNPSRSLCIPSNCAKLWHSHPKFYQIGSRQPINLSLKYLNVQVKYPTLPIFFFVYQIHQTFFYNSTHQKQQPKPTRKDSLQDLQFYYLETMHIFLHLVLSTLQIMSITLLAVVLHPKVELAKRIEYQYLKMLEQVQKISQLGRMLQTSTIKFVAAIQ
uniref:Transmembrane protein n=1 Tax=Spironucleus salmonicida TaxID=348837 RepID=V6LU33_9EUKA|eukprot:EST48120.1 Hypothetical protein SS50377_11719 [Spironucleus salmonicida]